MEYLIKPWEHQLKAIDMSKRQRDFALFFEMGTGKTATTINILRHKFAEHRRTMRTLILCPVVVCENWKREWALHSKVSHFVYVLKGSQKKRIEIFKEKIQCNSHPIFVTNYEALQMKELVQHILNWRPEIVVYDESHRLKNPQSVRAKIAHHISDLATHRYILTGTAVLNSPMDLWSQFRALDKGESFVDYKGSPINFYTFRNRYFTDKNSGMPSHKHFPKFVIQEGAFDELNGIIYRKAMRVNKDECLDLPPFIRTQVDCEMGPEQKEAYAEMKKHFIAYLENGEAVTASIALTKALRLQQIVSGFAKTENDKIIRFDDCPRLDALSEILEDIPEDKKVIIWSTFQENYSMITDVLKKLGRQFRELHGGVSGKDRQANIDAFQTDPQVTVMVANQGAGGIGVNLTAASYSIYYSKNFNLEHDLQSEARNYRGGSEIHSKVTRIDLVSPGTIDEIIQEALATKQDMANKILALKNRL